MILTLFETPLYFFDCDINLDSLYHKIKKFQSEVETSYKSNSGGYQGHKFNDEELNQYIKKNIPQNPNKPLLNFDVQAWVNINGNGHWNDVHNHCDDGVMLSGIFYINCPKNSGRIRFYDSRCNLSKSYIKYYEDAKGDYIAINPYNNLMLFFPPWLMHSVEPNQSNDHRISIAFNIVNPVF